MIIDYICRYLLFLCIVFYIQNNQVLNLKFAFYVHYLICGLYKILFNLHIQNLKQLVMILAQMSFLFYFTHVSILDLVNHWSYIRILLHNLFYLSLAKHQNITQPRIFFPLIQILTTKRNE